MIYEYTKNHPDLNGLRFCLNVLIKKGDNRVHVTRLKSDQGDVVATDGSRLHLYKMEKPLPDGLYRPLVQTQDYIILYRDPADQDKVCRLILYVL